ncbi:MAG: class I SAM-dependent methyltransferase [Gemmatimonadetes bacterium]|nr:class I SAM-dependent methyltransferase [Gemmatimonadota bacterium]
MDPKVFEACLEYTRALFAPEDDVLRALREEIRRRGFPEIYVSPEEGRLLQMLVCAVGAATVVEIGTLAGYSALWMARALPPGGRLITIEKEPRYAALAREFVRKAGLDGIVDVRVGVALEVLEDVGRAGPFDAFFIDADKVNYPKYLEWGLAHVRRGGLIMADNAYWGGAVANPEVRDPETAAIREYNERAARDPRLTSIVIPIRDGIAVSVMTR